MKKRKITIRSDDRKNILVNIFSKRILFTPFYSPPIFSAAEDCSIAADAAKSIDCAMCCSHYLVLLI